MHGPGVVAKGIREILHPYKPAVLSFSFVGYGTSTAIVQRTISNRTYTTSRDDASASCAL